MLRLISFLRKNNLVVEILSSGVFESLRHPITVVEALETTENLKHYNPVVEALGTTDSNSR
jgi:hypothetical protein